MMELRNKGVICLVTLPDSVVQAVEVDKNADGKEVLVKVCQNLRILEVDYFGLIYHGTKGEELWLNLRNPLAAELPGSPPYRMRFCVKFFVEPHFIQQDTTRKQFFLSVNDQFLSGKLRFDSDEEVVNLSALLLHIQQSDCKNSSRCCHSNVSAYSEQFLPPGFRSVNLARSVIDRITEFGSLGSEQAQGRFLQLAAKSSLFGVHRHEARDDSGRPIFIGVGQDALMEYEENWKLRRSWTWSAILTATHNCLSVILKMVEDDGISVTHSLKFASRSAANAFYRDMTEVHSFYHCDTIGSLVTEQYCRDFKGTIVSFFDDNTCLGKRYVFDIQHTLQETYDCVRRILYTAAEAARSGPDVGAGNPLATNGSAFTVSDACHTCSSACQALKQLNEIHESLLCRVCASADIDTALVPCGHTICCGACAKRLDSCPICKCSIHLAQTVFLPYVRPAFSASSGQLTVTCP